MKLRKHFPVTMFASALHIGSTHFKCGLRTSLFREIGLKIVTRVGEDQLVVDFRRTMLECIRPWRELQSAHSKS